MNKLKTATIPPFELRDGEIVQFTIKRGNKRTIDLLIVTLLDARKNRAWGKTQISLDFIATTPLIAADLLRKDIDMTLEALHASRTKR